MKKPIRDGVLSGILLTAPMVAVLYLGDQLFDLPFPPFDLFNWMVRVLPGPLITFGIDLMIDTVLLFGLDVADVAKTAERAMAVLQFFAGGVMLATLLFVVLNWRRQKGGAVTGLLAGALFGFPLVAISLAISPSAVSGMINLMWLALVFLIWGACLGWAYARLSVPAAIAGEQATAEREPAPAERAAADVERLSRRQFLITMGASAATVTVVGAGVGALLARTARRELEAAQEGTMAHHAEGSAALSFPNANDPVVPAPGTRPEYTPLKDHYQVFLNTEPTVIPAEGYVLPITGLVDNPLMLTLDEIYNDYTSFDQFITLSCISGRVGTTLISTTMWTGISLQDILAEAQVQTGAAYLNIFSGDGFYESVPLELIAADRRIMLCHSWDGNPLPVDHGFPLRIWIPDRFGMKQPKWIVSMEVSAQKQQGYWVERGWDDLAQVKTTSVIDTVAVDSVVESGTRPAIPIGGIAWAGDRQISAVEVRVNNGPWSQALLRRPLSETTWVIWRFDWPFEPGDHIFDVRTYEGDGTPQIETVAEARPSGSTGYHHFRVEI